MTDSILGDDLAHQIALTSERRLTFILKNRARIVRENDKRFVDSLEGRMRGHSGSLLLSPGQRQWLVDIERRIRGRPDETELQISLLEGARTILSAGDNIQLESGKQMRLISLVRSAEQGPLSSGDLKDLQHLVHLAKSRDQAD